MRRLLTCLTTLLIFAALAAPSWAGGGPANVLVLVNDNSPASKEIANHYRLKRQIPAGNFWHCAIPVKIEMTAEEFDQLIAQPLKAWLETAPCKPRIRFIVATEGFPYRIRAWQQANRQYMGDHYVSISAALATLDGKAMAIKHNPLAGEHTDWYKSDKAFLGTPQLPYLGFALMGDTTDDVLRCIDNGAASDGTAPKGTIYMFKGVGPRQRLAAGRTADQQQPVIDALAKKGIKAVKHSHDHSLSNEQDVMGYYTGFTRVKVDGWKALPGALGDHLTSFGGIIKGKNGQMPCTRFLGGGLTASYGTVTEPLNIYLRFPEAWLFDRYTDGFSAIESYWMATGEPRIGIFVGEPLASPYAARPTITLEGLGNAPLQGTAALKLSVQSATGTAFRDLEVWLDGAPLAGAPRVGMPDGMKVNLKVGDAGASFGVPGDWTVTQVVEACAAAFPASVPVTFEARGSQLLLRAKEPGTAGNELQWSIEFVAPESAGANPLAAPPSVDQPSLKLAGGKADEQRRAAVVLTIGGKNIQAGDTIIIAKGAKKVGVQAAAGDDAQKLAIKLLTELNKSDIVWKDPNPQPGRSAVPAAGAAGGKVKISLGSWNEAEAGNGEELTITVQRRDGSKLAVSPTGTVTTRDGATIRHHASAVVQFDAGVPSLQNVPLTLDCTALASGPHRLRVMVEEALPLAVQGWKVFDFEVQNEKGELKLDGLKDGAGVTAPFKLTPKLFRAARGGRSDIRFLVDGRVIDGTTKNKRKFTIDPAALQLGRGLHDVQAEILDDKTGAPFLRSAVIRFNYAVARPAAPAPPAKGKGKGKGKKKK